MVPGKCVSGLWPQPFYMPKMKTGGQCCDQSMSGMQATGPGQTVCWRYSLVFYFGGFGFLFMRFHFLVVDSHTLGTVRSLTVPGNIEKISSSIGMYGNRGRKLLSPQAKKSICY